METSRLYTGLSDCYERVIHQALPRQGCGENIWPFGISFARDVCRSNRVGNWVVAMNSPGRSFDFTRSNCHAIWKNACIGDDYLDTIFKRKPCTALSWCTARYPMEIIISVYSLFSWTWVFLYLGNLIVFDGDILLTSHFCLSKLTNNSNCRVPRMKFLESHSKVSTVKAALLTTVSFQEGE